MSDDRGEVLAAAGRTPSPEDVAAAWMARRDEFLGFLERRVGSRAVAEDVLQDAFARGLEKLETLRDEESAVAWFYRVLRNATLDHYRRKGARARAVENLATELETTREDEPLADAKDAICRCVGGLAKNLKPELAAALQRVDVDGASIATFADEAGITANNARVRLHRARTALREQVHGSCGTCAKHGCLDCTCRHDV